MLVSVLTEIVRLIDTTFHTDDRKKKSYHLSWFFTLPGQVARDVGQIPRLLHLLCVTPCVRRTKRNATSRFVKLAPDLAARVIVPAVPSAGLRVGTCNFHDLIPPFLSP